MDASRNDSPGAAAPMLPARATAASVLGSTLLRSASRRSAPFRVTALLVAVLLALAPAARAAGDREVRSGKWNPKEPPPGWVILETKHYQVQSQCGKEKTKALAAHLESMLDLYRKFLPTRRKLDGFVLKVFKDRQAFIDYSGSNAVAYYSQHHGELVGYDTGVILGKRDTPAMLGLTPEAARRFAPAALERLAQLSEQITDAYTMDTARVLSHEGWHQYFHFYTTSIVTMPSWLDEGVGDYFFMAALDEQNAHLAGYRLGDINRNRMRTLQRAFADGTSVSFSTLLGFIQEQYYTNPGVFYAQGWSMVQFLMHHEEQRFRELIPKLIKDFKDTKNFEKSTKKVFKGLDMDGLDRAWVGWVLAQPADDPLQALAREFGKELKASDFTGETRLSTIFEWYVEHPEFEFGGAPAAAPAADGS